jgi:hypothetical protein
MKHVGSSLAAELMVECLQSISAAIEGNRLADAQAQIKRLIEMLKRGICRHEALLGLKRYAEWVSLETHERANEDKPHA